MSEIGTSAPWVLLESDESLAESISRDTGMPLVVGRLLANRGARTAEDVQRFLNPSLDHLHDPCLLDDLEVGVSRATEAIKAGEPILVYGDYDVDGVTSAALLVRTLRALGARVDHRLPRRNEGYGIKACHVGEAADAGVGLIITCDCGINAFEAGEAALHSGIDLIITDHHEPGTKLPKATAVINPKRSECTYPFSELAGVGVALKFAQAVVRRLGHDEHSFLKKFLDLVAVGTVGDVVPLLDENRALVSLGLEAISSSKKLGLQTLLEKSGLSGKRITTYSLGYVIGPRINAVGRMDDAGMALNLLLTKDHAEAVALADRMEHCNSERKAEQDKILLEAMEQAKSRNAAGCRVLVMVGDGWNPGIVGIVAGRIRDTFFRPAIMLCRDCESGVCGGSARSIPDFNLYEALSSCSDVLERFGGHASAAGLAVREGNVSRFDEAINAIAADVIPEEALVPRVDIEAELSPSEVTDDLANVIARMEPFGTGNPEPVFLTRGLVVNQRQRVGDGSHLKLEVGSNGTAPLSCIAFRMGDECDKIDIGDRLDLCYHLRLNDFNGSSSVQLVVSGLRSSCS